jgi:hypothetical protein
MNNKIIDLHVLSLYMNEKHRVFFSSSSYQFIMKINFVDIIDFECSLKIK